MRTGVVLEALSELNENGFINEDTLGRMSAQEVVYAVAQASGEDTYDNHTN